MTVANGNPYHRIVLLVVTILTACRRADTPTTPQSDLAPGARLGPFEPIGRTAPHYVPGEAFTWKVTFKGFEGGRARLAVGQPGEVDGANVIVVQAQAESSGLFAAVKQVHDDAASWIDVATGAPRRSESESNLDGKQVVVHTAWRHDLGRAEQTIWKRDRKREKIVRLPAGGVHDPMSSLLVIRGWDAGEGSRGVFFTLGGTRLWRTELTVRGRETVASVVGERPCLRIDGVSTRMMSTAREDRKQKPRTFTVWLTDDAERIPVRIAAHTEYGDIMVDLTSYDAPVRPAVDHHQRDR
jgi:hypothetical protein